MGNSITFDYEVDIKDANKKYTSVMNLPSLSIMKRM